MKIDSIFIFKRLSLPLSGFFFVLVFSSVFFFYFFHVILLFRAGRPVGGGFLCHLHAHTSLECSWDLSETQLSLSLHNYNSQPAQPNLNHTEFFKILIVYCNANSVYSRASQYLHNKYSSLFVHLFNYLFITFLAVEVAIFFALIISRPWYVVSVVFPVHCANKNRSFSWNSEFSKNSGIFWLFFFFFHRFE